MTNAQIIMDRDRELELTDAERLIARARETETLLGLGMFAMVMHIAVVWLVVIILWPVKSTVLLLSWGTLLTIFLLWQAALIARYGGKTLSPAQVEDVERYYTIPAAGIGLGWAVCSSLLFPGDDLGRALFIVFVVGGMAMSAVASQHIKLRLCLIQITVGMAPLGIAYALSNLPYREVSGFLLLAYIAVLYSLAVRQHRFARKAIDLQIVQERLLRELSQQAGELEKARLVAEDANASKSRFLAQASHDLRQPLHAISLFVEALPAQQDRVQYDLVINKIRQSLDILTKLFDSLLDVTMLDTGGIEIKPVPFKLEDIVNQVVSDFGLIAEANEVELRAIPTSIAVRSDPVLLTRMLQNLVSNAIRHAPGNRTLIGCRRRAGSISLIVADGGPGISEADQKRIFKEFERLEDARMGDAATPGLGLGLSIVQRIANEMELEIRLQSKPGHGTIFEIAGLEQVAEQQVAAEPRRADRANILDGLTVHILDDSEETLEATQLLLRKWGCQTFIATTPDMLPDDRPDLLICDYELSPKMTGLDALNPLQQRYGRNVPAIMISGHSSEALKKAVAERDIPLLNKPVRPAPLRSAMLQAIARSDETA